MDFGLRTPVASAGMLDGSPTHRESSVLSPQSLVPEIPSPRRCYLSAIVLKGAKVKSKIAVVLALLCFLAVSGAEAQKGKKKVTARDYANTLAVLKTDEGDITIKFHYDKAPKHVENFINLAGKGFYDRTMFHRIIPGFMIQGGDPLTRSAEVSGRPYGTGGNVVDGKEVRLKAEFNDTTHRRGIVSMARAADPNSASSQFFIVVKDAPYLDNQYTAFGEVVSGMDVADQIVAAPRNSTDRPNKPVRIQKVVLSQVKSLS
jgi:peptidyl-prolyl cis-trans isomerase B (cyclophilin B)